jgi:hypothetical protein
MNESKRIIAASLLSKAASVVSYERGNQHGGAEDSFKMIAEFWEIYLRHTHRIRHNIELQIEIRPCDVAQMMSLLKKARFVHGDPLNADNFVDDTGYTSLAGMLALPEDPFPGSLNVKPKEDPKVDLDKLEEDIAPKRYTVLSTSDIIPASD